MKNLLQILLNQSLRDLFKHKSFFLLVFILIMADRLLRLYVKVDRSSLHIPEIRKISLELAEYVFNDLPSLLIDWIFDYRTVLVAIALFLLKQLISMWPSSDMRRMHRMERERFGLISSLVAIHGRQVVWDAIAVGSIVTVIGVWSLMAYGVTFAVWQIQATYLPLFILGFLVFLSLPIGMAGFSYSSKLAVLSKGSFSEKLKLFFKLFLDKRVFTASWLFFLVRIAIELVFVVILPVLVILFVDFYLLRIAIAGLIATPFYSFLKMASFKFFLQVYREFPLVKQEYSSYYTGI